MTAINYSIARDVIYGAALATVQANASLFGYTPEVRYKDVRKTAAPDASKVWLRFSMQTVLSTQKSLSTEVSASGKRRYVVDGLFFAQMFLPMSQANMNEQGILLARALKDALRKYKGDVILRNVRINELSPEDKQYRLNVVAEYEYDEIA